MYDNETGKWLYDKWMIDADDCLWFDDQDGYTYIIPAFDSMDEIDGPDDTWVIDKLAYLCRHTEGRNPTVEEVEGLRNGLTYVPHMLRRFNEIDGYYHA